MNAQERSVMQAALDALENHPGNYKLSDKQCDAYDAISKTIRATLKVPALPLAAPVTKGWALVPETGIVNALSMRVFVKIAGFSRAGIHFLLNC